MAKSSINFQKASGHSYDHNFRKNSPNYLLKEKDRLENSYWQNEKSAKEIFENELSNAKRKGGRIPKFENSHCEAVLNLNKNHTLDDVKKVAEHIEKKFNFICATIAIHRDEGHYNKNGKAEHNFHAHITFVTYKDSTQNWRKAKIKPQDLSELQTEVAEILKMERGAIDSKAVRLEHNQYKEVAKTQEKLKEVEQELQSEKLSKAEIKAEFEKFRKENIGQGLSGDFFKELGAEKKKLLAEPNATKQELQEYFLSLKEKHKRFIGTDKDAIIEQLQSVLIQENEKNAELKAISNDSIRAVDINKEKIEQEKADFIAEQERENQELLKKKKKELEREYQLKEQENEKRWYQKLVDLTKDNLVKQFKDLYENMKEKYDKIVDELKGLKAQLSITRDLNSTFEKENKELQNENRLLRGQISTLSDEKEKNDKSYAQSRESYLNADYERLKYKFYFQRAYAMLSSDKQKDFNYFKQVTMKNATYESLQKTEQEQKKARKQETEQEQTKKSTLHLHR